MPLSIQKISPSLAAAAEEALGGPLVAPPGVIIGPVELNPNEEGQKAFTVAAAKIQSEAKAAAPEPLGHPLLDGIPADLAARRTKVETVRGRLAALARQIQTDATELGDILKELAPDHAAILASEIFDTTKATQFLTDLSKAVTKLTEPKADAKR